MDAQRNHSQLAAQRLLNSGWLNYMQESWLANSNGQYSANELWTEARQRHAGSKRSLPAVSSCTLSKKDFDHWEESTSREWFQALQLIHKLNRRGGQLTIRCVDLPHDDRMESIALELFLQNLDVVVTNESQRWIPSTDRPMRLDDDSSGAHLFVSIQCTRCKSKHRHHLLSIPHTDRLGEAQRVSNIASNLLSHLRECSHAGNLQKQKASQTMLHPWAEDESSLQTISAVFAFWIAYFEEVFAPVSSSSTSATTSATTNSSSRKRRSSEGKSNESRRRSLSKRPRSKEIDDMYQRGVAIDFSADAYRSITLDEMIQITHMPQTEQGLYKLEVPGTFKPRKTHCNHVAELKLDNNHVVTDCEFCSHNHEGNRRFRRLVSSHRITYAELSSLFEQEMLIQNILRNRRMQPKRVFIRVQRTTSELYELEAKECASYVRRALERGFPELMRSPREVTQGGAESLVTELEGVARKGVIHTEIVKPPKEFDAPTRKKNKTAADYAKDTAAAVSASPPTRKKNKTAADYAKYTAAAVSANRYKEAHSILTPQQRSQKSRIQAQMQTQTQAQTTLTGATVKFALWIWLPIGVTFKFFPHPEVGIYVHDIDPAGFAGQTGQLRPLDILVGVNAVDTTVLSLPQLKIYLDSLQDPFARFTFKRRSRTLDRHVLMQQKAAQYAMRNARNLSQFQSTSQAVVPTTPVPRNRHNSAPTNAGASHRRREPEVIEIMDDEPSASPSNPQSPQMQQYRVEPQRTQGAGVARTEMVVHEGRSRRDGSGEPRTPRSNISGHTTVGFIAVDITLPVPYGFKVKNNGNFFGLTIAALPSVENGNASLSLSLSRYEILQVGDTLIRVHDRILGACTSAGFFRLLNSYHKDNRRTSVHLVVFRGWIPDSNHLRSLMTSAVESSGLVQSPQRAAPTIRESTPANNSQACADSGYFSIATTMPAGLRLSQKGDFCVFVTEILPGGKCHQSGVLKYGDQIVAIQHEIMQHATLHTVLRILSQHNGRSMVLTFGRGMDKHNFPALKQMLDKGKIPVMSLD